MCTIFISIILLILLLRAMVYFIIINTTHISATMKDLTFKYLIGGRNSSNLSTISLCLKIPNKSKGMNHIL